jgi:uncharacterized protein YndB with AHSA1/START domain
VTDEVRISRVFAAPRELVFNAWIDPDQIAVWCAPEGCEVPRETVDIDPRPGGRIHFSMVDAASGDVIPVRFEVLEISRPELLVLASDPQPEFGLPHRMLTRVVFEADGGATRLTLTQGPHTDDMRREADRGWASALDKLEACLRRPTSP